MSLLLIISFWGITFGFVSGFIGLLTIGYGIFISVKSHSYKKLTLTIIVWLCVNIVLVPVTVKNYNRLNNN